MLRDKMLVFQITVPAMTSGKTVTLKTKDLKIPDGEAVSLQVLPISSGNYSVAKKYNTTTKKYTIVVTASGSVNANTVVTFLGQPVSNFIKATVAAVDA